MRRANGEAAGDRPLFPALLSGQNLSALFLADGRRPISSASAGNGRRPLPAQPYRYGGAVRLRRFDRQDNVTIGRWLTALTARTGLEGLCSADFIKTATATI